MPSFKEAQFRYAKYYEAVLRKIDQLYKRGAASLTQGTNMFEIEWDNIRTAQIWSKERAGEDKDLARLCSLFPDAGAYILYSRQHPTERISWLEAAYTAAHQLKDKEAMATHLNNLGLANFSLGNSKRAIELYKRSLQIWHKLNNRQGEASALGNLGLVHSAIGQPKRALKYYTRVLNTARRIRSRHSEANAQGNLGILYTNIGKPQEAIRHHQKQLSIARQMRDLRGKVAALGGLGNAYYLLGDFRCAVNFYRRSLLNAKKLGERRLEAALACDVGNALRNYLKIGFCGIIRS